MSERVTDCELGPIWHRPTTRLLPQRRCSYGHVAPNYGRGECVVCNKLRTYENLGRVPSTGRPRGLHLFTDYAAARARHEEIGGWLLVLGDGIWGCGDDPRAVQRLRGAAWMWRCDQLEIWDETEIEAAPPKPR